MKIKVEFKNDSGQVTTATFDRDAGTVTGEDGRVGKYARPEGSKVMEITGDQTMTLTFADDIKFEPGFSTRYSGPNGAGSATIVSIG